MNKSFDKNHVHIQKICNKIEFYSIVWFSDLVNNFTVKLSNI